MTIEIARVYSLNTDKTHRMFKNTKIVLSRYLKDELKEWLKCDLLEISRCWLPPLDKGLVKVSLHTDSSLCQLGGVLYRHKTKIGEFKRGFEENLNSYPIACKEGLAIYYSLLHFRQFLKKKIIQLHVDNQTVCWAFEKEGSKCRVLNLIVIKILRLIKSLDSQYEIVWTPTKLQVSHGHNYQNHKL